ncbi:hypothetical protein KZY93_000668 [Vibrio vulnificus]|nr:hypothetical protein [Vibrio vulnificus]EHU9517345.1 hypothetical protein [Vibrio vulnificus]EJD0673072.1 hypothetical protein [Vibrio vulnificus]
MGFFNQKRALLPETQDYFKAIIVKNAALAGMNIKEYVNHLQSLQRDIESLQLLNTMLESKDVHYVTLQDLENTVSVKLSENEQTKIVKIQTL